MKRNIGDGLSLERRLGSADGFWLLGSGLALPLSIGATALTFLRARLESIIVCAVEPWRAFRATFRVRSGEEHITIMANPKISEELLAAPLPKMIQELGMAVANANKELAASNTDIQYTINSAEIELKVALSMSQSSDVGVSGGAALSVASVNASYSRTYGFKEEASSSIKLTLAAVPRAAGAGAAGGGKGGAGG